MNSLPLSWSYKNGSMENSQIIKGWDIEWYAINSASVEEFKDQFRKNNLRKKDTIIRGCTVDIKNYLKEHGYSSFHIGVEAVLNTDRNPFEKKSLMNQVKRGMRNGKIVTLPYSSINSSKLKEFRNESVHGQVPQLENLFKVEFTENQLLHIFIDDQERWLGAVMLSENSKNKLHTELLLRRDDSPNGIMEALIEYSFNFAKENGYSFLSLGEVPFIFRDRGRKNFYRFLLEKAAGYFLFAYNYRGLFDFKNKFNPDWQNIYICSKNKLGLKQFLFLLINSNFHNLMFHRAIMKLGKLNYFTKYVNNRIFVPGSLDFNKT